MDNDGLCLVLMDSVLVFSLLLYCWNWFQPQFLYLLNSSLDSESLSFLTSLAAVCLLSFSHTLSFSYFPLSSLSFHILSDLYNIPLTEEMVPCCIYLFIFWLGEANALRKVWNVTHSWGLKSVLMENRATGRWGLTLTFLVWSMKGIDSCEWVLVGFLVKSKTLAVWEQFEFAHTHTRNTHTCTCT